MKHRLILCMMLLTLVPVFARGQNRVQAASPEEIIAAIDRSASSLRSLRCDFVQTKELSLLQDRMVSQGVMYYRQAGGQLRWEYRTPYRYTFVLNGDRVMMRSDGRTDVVETSANRMFREIARMMMSTLTGRCLTATSDFDIRVRAEKGLWIAELTPRRREMTQFFARVNLCFDPERQLVTRVEMVEAGGDRTVIELKNVQRNATIDESVFAID